MANGYFRIDTGAALTPYLGAGVGGAVIDVRALSDGSIDWFRAHDVQFAYEGIAGISYTVGARTSLGFEYRFFATTTPSFTDDPSGGGA